MQLTRMVTTLRRAKAFLSTVDIEATSRIDLVIGELKKEMARHAGMSKKQRERRKAKQPGYTPPAPVSREISTAVLPYHKEWNRGR